MLLIIMQQATLLDNNKAKHMIVSCISKEGMKLYIYRNILTQKNVVIKQSG